MKLNRWALGAIVGLCLGLGLGYVLAQTVVIQGGLTGNEAVLAQAGGPGGTGFYTNVASLRNGTIYAFVGPGTTVTQTISPNVGQVIVTGAITTLNLSLPLAPYDQQAVRISCPGGVVTTLVVSAPGDTIIGPADSTCTTTPATSMVASFVYSTSATTWWRIE